MHRPLPLVRLHHTFGIRQNRRRHQFCSFSIHQSSDHGHGVCIDDGWLRTEQPSVLACSALCRKNLIQCGREVATEVFGPLYIVGLERSAFCRVETFSLSAWPGAFRSLSRNNLPPGLRKNREHARGYSLDTLELQSSAPCFADIATLQHRCSHIWHAVHTVFLWGTKR